MCLKKVKGFLFEPSSAFKREQKTTVGAAFKYMLILSIVSAVLGGIVTSALAGNVVMLVGSIVMLYVVFIIGTTILGIILHIFAFIVGARGGFGQTLKAVYYGATPNMLLSWIPYIGFIFVIWNLILNIIGIKNLHNISTGRAVLAVLIPVIILTLLMIAGLLAFLSIINSMGGLPLDQLGAGSELSAFLGS
ncbi:MAG: YIP1 family protein [Candidatus Aenigmarchaeota archaeon]|nr:YIP1 family protein [Candidatus Aenigmarchaeota archaeon]